MKRFQQLFREPLIQRLSVFFLILGLLPALVLAAAPTIYVMLHGADLVAESLLLMWAGQGITFLIIVLVGAGVTLKRLAIPIQELAHGAEAIMQGDLSYRVPVRSGDEQLVTLTRSFNEMAEAVETMRDRLEQERTDLQVVLDMREKEFQAMLEIAHLVNSQRDLNSKVERALNIARSSVGTDVIALVLVDERGEVSAITLACEECLCDHALRICDQCPEQCSLKQVLHRMSDNILRQVFETRESFGIDDLHASTVALDPQVRTGLEALRIRKFYLKPLIGRTSTLGALVLMRYSPVDVPMRAVSLLENLTENITVLIENWRLQNKARSWTIMEERRRLANDLHDSVTQSLFTLSLTARGLESSLKDVPDVAQEALQVIVDQTRVIQTEMRTLINELRPIDLEGENLERALGRHAQSLNRSANTEVEIDIQGNVHSISQATQQHLNRIVQEALSNVARHAHATNAEIGLDVSPEMITLTIKDDGVGFDPHEIAMQSSQSLGLISIRERVEMMGGALMLRSQPAEGTTLIARIPMQAGNGGLG